MAILSGDRRAPAQLFTHLSGHLFAAHYPVCVHVVSIPKDDFFLKLLRLLQLVKREAAMWRRVYGLYNAENARRQGTGGRDAGPHGLLRGNTFTVILLPARLQTFLLPASTLFFTGLRLFLRLWLSGLFLSSRKC